MEIEDMPSLDAKLSAFHFVMKRLKNEYSITSEKILHDFYLQVPFYNGLCDTHRKIKPECIEKVNRFASLFDKQDWNVQDFGLLIEDQLFLADCFDEGNRSKKAKGDCVSSLQIKDLPNILREHLSPFISSAVVFAKMAHDCQKLLREHLEQEEKFGFDDILSSMRSAIQRPEFRHLIRAKYKVAIIDEFQDTDPLQWEIFQRLFLQDASDWGHLYLVGDPKQSIYAFRQADIYTYLAASRQIGTQNHASLDTNYRSQPSLIKALNTLFSDQSTPGWISLPSERKEISYSKVKTPESAAERQFSDKKGSLHFYIAEDGESWKFPLERLEKDYFFPFMVQEIQQLSTVDGLPLNHFAVLVSDRFQAARVSEFLKLYHIPAVTQRSVSLTESPAWMALIDLMKGFFTIVRRVSLNLPLGVTFSVGIIIKYHVSDDSSTFETILFQFQELKRTLYSEGLPSFYRHLMQTCWHEDGVTVAERLLSQEDSAGFYSDLQQIIEILFERENRERLTPEALLDFLTDYKILSFNENKEFMRLLEPSKLAVNIMTMHASKGLEFDIVFTPVFLNEQNHRNS